MVRLEPARSHSLILSLRQLHLRWVEGCNRSPAVPTPSGGLLGYKTERVSWGKPPPKMYSVTIALDSLIICGRTSCSFLLNLPSTKSAASAFLDTSEPTPMR